MAAVLANGASLGLPDDYTQTVPPASSPASPSASFMIQQTHSSMSYNGNGTSYSDHSQPTTPTSFQTNIPLDSPPGMSFPEYLRTWTDSHVAAWLASIKCLHQAPLFRENDIRGDVLLELDQMTLKEMGMYSVGDRIRVVAGVKALRQRSSAAHGRPRAEQHGRTGSLGSENSSLTSQTSRTKRLDNGRPTPIIITPGAGSGSLPRLILDGQESARATQPTIRPLPQPVAHPQSNRSGLPPLPPPPRSQPPPPPPPSARTPHRTLLPPTSALSGRRTPTLPDPPAFNTSQPLPPAPTSLLTPISSHDPRQTPSGARQIRSPSPLNNSQHPNRNLNRSPNEHGRTSSSSGIVGGSPMKLPPRTTSAAANTGHPYALQAIPPPQTALSPIAENFNTHRRGSGTPSPPTSNSQPYRGPPLPFARPGTPSQAQRSLDDINRNVIKFCLPGGGKWSKISVADTISAAEILTRALKKLRGVDDVSHTVETVDGALCVDGWGVFAEYADGLQRNPLTEAQLLSICHGSPDGPAREHGLTLRQLDRSKRTEPGSPYLTAFPRASGSTETLNETIQISKDFVAPAPGSNAFKRASSGSVLGGLGVQIPDPPLSSAVSLNLDVSPSKSPNKKGKLRNFFGQRPPSELITNHLAEYFPFTEKKVLERTRRQSMFRASNANIANKRDSIISWNPPQNQSRFSVSTQGSALTLGASPRNSFASHMSMLGRTSPPPPLPTEDSSSSPPRVSISAEDGHSVADLSSESEAQKRASKRMSRPHLLPPVAISSESLAESLNLTSSRPSSRMSTASSKRMSFITELRSKRDRSDTASMLTVDEITAEVESRQESCEESDGWTAVNSSEADAQSIKEFPEDEAEEDGEESEESEEESEGDLTEGIDSDEDDAPGVTIMSHGEVAIKWIRGALIGSGSFGKVYLGMDAATGLLMAVKQVELPTGSAPNEERKKLMLSALEHEIELLKELHHENIVQYHSSCVDGDHLNIFLEYVPGGSVTSLLRNYGAFEEPLVRNWVRQILLGLNYLHERDIIHRDIKGANMLVDNKGGIKISDFGISKKVEDNLLPGHRAHRPSLQGSVFWMAPEVVKQTAYTQKADIWSVGCLIVEMLTGEHPYPQLSQMQAIFKIGMSSKPSIPPDISPEAENFLQLTFELDHEARPSASELLKHPWVSNLMQ